jgi:hypothetical protein
MLIIKMICMMETEGRFLKGAKGLVKNGNSSSEGYIKVCM